MMNQKRYTVGEVAKQLRCSTDLVLLAIKNKRLRATRIGERKWSIEEYDLEQWLKDGSHTAPLTSEQLADVYTEQGDENSQSASRLRHP